MVLEEKGLALQEEGCTKPRALPVSEDMITTEAKPGVEDFILEGMSVERLE
jgi:hypothetical protein